MEEEKVTLFDSNIASTSRLIPELYNIRSYSKVDIEEVIRTTNMMSRLIGQMHAREVITIKDVAEELADLQKTIIDKTKFLNLRKGDKSYEAETHMDLLNDMANRLVKKVKGHIYKPQFPHNYTKLEALLAKLDHTFSINKREGKYTNKAQYRTTDNKLAALSFYIPLFEHKKAQILTSDEDILKLASTLFYTLTYALDGDYCRMALEKLSKFQVSITNHRGRWDHNFPNSDGSYKVFGWFNRINNEMKEDAKKIIRMSYGIKN